LQRNRGTHTFKIDLAIEMQIFELTIDRFRHRVMLDTKILSAEFSPFGSVLRGIAIASPATAQHCVHEIWLLRQHIILGNHDAPLHPRHEVQRVEA